MKNNSFIHLSLRRRIYLCFFLLVLLFGIGGAVTLATLDYNKKLSAHVTNVVDPALETIDELNKMVLQSKMYTTNWVFLRAGQEDKERLIILHKADYPALKLQLHQYSSQWNNPYFNDSLKEVMIRFEALLAVEKEIMGSLKKFEDYDDLVIRMQAEQKIEEEVLPRTLSLMNTLKNIDLYGQQIRLLEHRNLDQSSEQLRTIMIALAITIFGAGLFLSLYLAKIIISPIRQIKNIVTDLGKGIIRQTEGPVQKDEIGEMILAVNQLSEKTLATAKFAYEVGKRNVTIPFQPLSEEDVLGKALITMRDNLDISEKELLRSAEKAEAASIAKSEFMANMSHELRTPMNGIMGFTDLVLTTPLQDTQRQYLQNVSKSANNLLGIINDILDFSKLDAGKLVIDNNNFKLSEIIEETVDLLSIKAQEKGLEIICNIDPRLPVSFEGDDVRIRQVLVNLLGNAIKFTNKGEILVTVQQTSAYAGHADKQMADITIAVQDTGIGIPEEKLSDIFESFTQADASTTRKFGGTGLGLTISKRLAELMKGRLIVKSIYGQGSTFSLELPLEVINDQPRASMDIKGILGKVLVIDDNVTNCNLMQGIFEYLNIPCEICGDGPMALVKIQQAINSGHLFDLIITDQQMPGMDGMTLVREIKKIVKGSGEPFILMLSSLEKTLLQQEAEKMGIDKFLSKPVKLQELVSLLNYVFNTSVETVEIKPIIPKIVQFTDRTQILVAEDNPMNMLLITEVLGNMGLAVLPASDGAEAVELLLHHNPAMIFMDINMPVMDGITATQEIRKLTGPKASIPIIALTADAMKEDKERCLAAGMNDFLAKPFRLREIEFILKNYLYNRAA